MLENAVNTCTCKKKKCLRHGKCNECIEYHKNSKRVSLPYCKRPKSNLINKLFGKSDNGN